MQELRMAARERTQVRMGARGGAASTFPQPAADADVAPPSAPPLKQFAAGDGVAEEEGATEASASEAPAPPAPPPGPPEYPLQMSTELGVQATAIKQDMSTRKGIKTYQQHWRAYVAWYQVSSSYSQMPLHNFAMDHSRDRHSLYLLDGRSSEGFSTGVCGHTTNMLANTTRTTLTLPSQAAPSCPISLLPSPFR